MEKSEFTLEFEKPLRELESQLHRLRETSVQSRMDVSEEISAIEKKIEKTKRDVYSGLTVWERVQLARHPKRPTSLDHIGYMFDSFEEVHGDRLFKDDPAFVGGIAFLDSKPVMVIGQQKGRDTKGNLRRNFGCPHPEGYRKALRLMRLANKFNMPIISLIDTPGAFPGIGAEERHVAEAIAVNIREMTLFTVPIIAVIIGEGGSGGALGVALADSVLILENAYYSVISPEGCAAILWKDRKFAPEAAKALGLCSQNLLDHGIVEEVIEEPFGGAQRDPKRTANTLKSSIKKHLNRLSKLSTEKLLEERYNKFRRLGVSGE